MTLAFPSEWIGKAEQALDRLGEKPWALFFLLLVVNSIAQPYAGIAHDARLYSVQVLNQVEDGAYADDLFFRYGSQDQYSLFSRLAAPLARCFGLSVAFFLIYLASKSVLIYGMMRIAQALVPNRTATTLALIYCMAIPLHYGGHHILKIQENFVTPRALACGIVLIGLDLTVRGRSAAALVMMVVAAAIHPLMACGGLLIWGAFHVWKLLGLRAFVGACIVTVALVATMLAIEPIGIRSFGAMDDAWRQAILHASSFNFPSQWSNEDWAYLAIQIVIIGTAIWYYPSADVDKKRFLVVALLVALAGVGGAVVAENLPYALLLQGQPYRALWILAFLHLILAVWMCIELTKQATVGSQLASCLLLGYLCTVDAITEEYVTPLFLIPVIVLAVRGMNREPRTANWLVQSIRISLVVGAVVWMGYKFYLLALGVSELHRKYPDDLEILEIFLVNIGPAFFLIVVCLLLVRWTPERWSSPGWVALTAAVWLALQTSCFAFVHTDFYRVQYTRYRADLVKLHDLLHASDTGGTPLPTVYCNLGCVDYTWLDLHAKSYFDWWQAGNFMFRREMALEGDRRASIVGPFEIERYRKIEDQLTVGHKEVIARLYKTDFDRGPIREEDLARLCREPDLDYLVLETRFPGLYRAQAGRLYLYECRQVRTALHIPDPRPATRIASSRIN